MSVIGQVTALITALAAFITTLATLISKVRENSDLLRSMRELKLLIGVIGKVPTSLSSLPCYANKRTALRSGRAKVVILYKKLSLALRDCDYVCADAYEDEKIYHPDDAFWERLAHTPMPEK